MVRILVAASPTGIDSVIDVMICVSFLLNRRGVFLELK
jgi:hypothetical protein